MGKRDPLPNPRPRARDGEDTFGRGEGEDTRGTQERERACPFCQATDVAVISLFGSQVMTMQCRCRQCGSYFEATKY